MPSAKRTTLPPDLTRKRFIIVLGKGGVGRTTVAATLAWSLARQGKRTLLYQANAKEKVSALYGSGPIGTKIVRVQENLWAVNTNPTEALHEYGLMVLRYETIYKMVFENRFAKALVRAIPGVDDYAIIGKAWYHTTEAVGGKPRWDVVVFDAPATGHAVTMLRIPRAILEAVPEGPLTRDAAKVRTLLEDRAQTSVILVTIAEEMPVSEATELAARLPREVGVDPSLLIVNQLYPERFREGTVPARVLTALQGGDPVLAPLLSRARLARARRELNDEYLHRLAKDLPIPTVHLPALFKPNLGLREIEILAHVLEEQLAARQEATSAAPKP